MESVKLHIEKAYSEPYFDTYIVDGLSVDEMSSVLYAHRDGKDDRDVLVEVMSKHPNDSSYGQNIAEGWKCGYGIYSIRHFGGSLLVKVGNNCD